MDSLCTAVRDWQRGVVAKGVLLITIGIAGLAFLAAYGSDLLAGANVRSIELIPGWFALRPLEHRVSPGSLAALLGPALGAVLVFGLTPLVSERMHWWTRQRWALVTAMAILSGGTVANFAELLQKGSVTDFLQIQNLGDFSVGDFLITVGVAGVFVLLAFPDYVGVRKRHIAFAIGAAAASLASLPLIRPPLSHLLPLGLVLASLAWLAGYCWWRIAVGNRLLGTLAMAVPNDPGPETDRVLADLEVAVQNNAHIDLAATTRALAKLADAYWRLGRPEDLRRTSDTYLRTAEEVNNDRMKAWALDCLGFVYGLEDDPAKANGAWQESLRLANQQRDDRHKLLLLANIAWAEVELDRADDAQRTYASALDLAERLGNTEMTSRLRYGLSLLRRPESGSPETSG